MLTTTSDLDIRTVLGASSMSADLLTHGTLQCRWPLQCTQGAVRALLPWISQGINADQMRLQFKAYWEHLIYAVQVCVLINMIDPAAWPKPLF
jgi:hypothetical protein